MNPSKHIDAYLAEYKNLVAPATYNTCKAWLKKFRNWSGTKKSPRTDEWVDYLKSTMAPVSARVGMVVITGFYNWCLRRDWVQHKQIQRSRVDVPASNRPAFTEEEYRKLLLASHQPWTAIIMVAWHTGMRYRDVMRLRPESVDVDKLAIRIVPNKTKRMNKKVTIPVTRELINILEPLMDRVFIFSEQAITCDDGYPRAVFRKIREKAGIKGKSFHSFRHAFVTRMLENGVQPAYIGMMTGQSVDQVMLYQRVSEDKLREMVFGDPAGTVKEPQLM